MSIVSILIQVHPAKTLRDPDRTKKDLHKLKRQGTLQYINVLIVLFAYVRVNVSHIFGFEKILSLKTFLYIMLFLLFSLSGVEASSLPADLTESALLVIDLVYKENFKLAEEEAKKIVKKYPEHPAGYFFSAVAIDSWMAMYQSKSRENEFYQLCDQTIIKGEAMLGRNKNDEWVKFFIAGADGYKGTYEARFEHWITAFRYGWQGVSKMIDLESVNSKIVDINYGIGSYDYWRSAMIKTLWFMPNVDDRRQKGIERLYNAMKEGVFTKNSSAVALVDVLLNENRYEEVLSITSEMLKKYPDSQVFNFGEARALYGVRKYDESITSFDRLYFKCKDYTDGDHYMVIICHLWLAKNYFMLNKTAQAMVECNRMTYYKISNDTRKLLEKQFNEADGIKKKIYAAQGK